jgi:(5-formylfuran-3-yl)methyl phosphate synthase
MSLMLASVRGLDEVDCCLAAGVDILDLKEPAAGSLGAVDPSLAARVVARVAGRCVVSATLGDLGGDDPTLLPLALAMAGAGVDIIKVGLFDARVPAAIEGLARACPDQALAAVAFADGDWRTTPCERLAAAGVVAVVLDTREKHRGGLLGYAALDELAVWLDEVRRHGLKVGLAGGIGSAEVPQLLGLQPDFLGFRGALCSGGRSGAVVAARVQQLRAMIPGQQQFFIRRHEVAGHGMA